LERAARSGFRRIVVFPYFLFTGVLVKRIYAQTDAVAERFPEIEFIKAGYLRDHPLVLDAFAERAGELDDKIGGRAPAMNCQFCKYRTQIIGYEAEIGAAQRGHHHHVRVSAPMPITSTLSTIMATITTNIAEQERRRCSILS